MIQRNLVIVRADDWAALYQDGLLVLEGHQITARDVADQAGSNLITLSYVSASPATDAFLEERGSFAPKLADVPV